MRKFAMSRDAFKFVSELDAKRFKQVIVKIFALANEPVPPDSELLKGYDGRRADIGEFRIVYTFDEDTVSIDLIGKRNDDEVYKQLKRR